MIVISLFFTPLSFEQPEIVIDESSTDMSTGKTPRPSISGTLPLLLLSVLPPLIPRASWPNTEHMQVPMRRSICFSSQQHIRNSSDANASQMPAIDLLNLRLTQQQRQQQQQNSERYGLFNRIRNLFGTKASSRKTSTASLTPTTHIANAIKSHMNMITDLLPSTSSSCHVLNSNSRDRDSELTSSGSRCGGRKQSMAFTISAHVEKVVNIDVDEREEEHVEPRVNFILPTRRRSSIIHKYSQPTLRERVKGSPRFPHRIVLTSSLNAIEDSLKGLLKQILVC